MIREFIRDGLDGFDLVSIDLFDTFFLRPFLRPTDLFICLAGEDFAKARVDAESRSRRSNGERATIDSIYSEIDEKYRYLKDSEIGLEEKLIVVNPEIKELYDVAISRGKKVVFTSDMYLGKDIIARMLESKGIRGYSGIYVSCDHGCSKGSGALLGLMLREQGVDCRRAVHVGDSRHADMAGGSRACMYTLYVPRIADRFFEENYFAKSFVDRHGRMDRYCIRAFLGALALAYHLNKYSPGYSIWNRVGCLISGTMAYMYALFIERLCKSMGKDRILFSLRDGYIVGRLAEFMFDGIKCDYVYGNRKMSNLLFAALNGSDGEREQTCLKYFRNMDIDAGKTILVDGFSNHRSMQRALEKMLGADLTATYFVVTGDGDEKSVAYAKKGLLPNKVSELYEFCTGSCERDMSHLDKDMKPVYSDGSNNAYEEYRSKAYSGLVDSAVATARAMSSVGVDIPMEELASYIRHYSVELPLHDRQFFINQFKPTDVRGVDYSCVFWG